MPVRSASLVLTATARLGRYLRTRHVPDRASARADFLPLNDWLCQIWMRLGGAAPLESAHIRWFWEDLLKQDERVSAALLDVAGMAAQTDDAFVLQCLYRTPPPHLLDTAEARLFQDWARRFTQRLATLPSPGVHPAQLPSLLQAAVVNKQLPLPPLIYLAGFDELPPAVQSLFDTMAERGVQILLWPDSVSGSTLSVFAMPDPAQEVRWVANRIRQNFQPGKRVGVIVPDLASYRPHIERIFLDSLDPAACLLDGQERTQPFDISQGECLEKVPIVQHALALLRLSLRPMTPADASSCLLMAFPFQDMERGGRAVLELALRRESRQISLFRLSQRCLEYAPHFGQRLRALHQLLRHAPLRDACCNWAAHFSACLEAMAWPGDILSDGENAACQAWQTALTKLSGFDQIAPFMTRAEALQGLEQICRSTLFQLKASTDSIQVMGYLEAAGLHFDEAYILGMHDRAMPAPVRPNPFLPVRWQRQQRMPFADPDQQLRFAQAIWQRLSWCAPELLCSYPMFDGELSLKPSPLLTDLSVHTIDAHMPPFWHEWPRAGQFVPEAGNNVPPLQLEESGPAFLNAQLACSFMAFARHRLRAMPVAPYETRPTARDMGILIHDVLQDFWRRHGSQVRLADLIREQTLQGVVREMVRRHILAADYGIDAAHADALENTLEQLLLRALALEAQRPAFEVEAVEQALQYMLGGLTLRLRLDRIDRQLHDGKRIVIDYKTGAQVESKSWLPPMTDAQMPLYVLATSADAAVYLKLNREKEVGWDGQGRNGCWPGISPVADWTAQHQAWRETLAELAAAYQSGEVRVLPREGLKTCEYCGMQALCRVHERAAHLPDEEN